jgi:hypothetical protein
MAGTTSILWLQPGDDYIIELKYVLAQGEAEVKEENKNVGQADKLKPKAKDPVLTLERLKAKMNEVAQSAMAQIDLKKYVKKFQGSAIKFIK